MRPACRTLLFPRPFLAIAAIKILGDSGTPASRISIQSWGSGIALRTRDSIGSPCLEQLIALGGEPVTNPGAALGPSGGLPSTRPDRRLHAHAMVHR